MNPFDAAYEGTPPWDIGRPQQAFVDLLAQGRIQGRVLDSGCGTGDLAIHLAQAGLDVVGVDASARAIARAREKAREQRVELDLLTMDVLAVANLKQVFDTVVDCGLFHTLTDLGARRYVNALSRVMRPGGLVHILCFSDAEPNWGGPRRVTRAMLEERFAGWWLEDITAATFANNRSPNGSAAWRATFGFYGRASAGLH